MLSIICTICSTVTVITCMVCLTVAHTRTGTTTVSHVTPTPVPTQDPVTDQSQQVFDEEQTKLYSDVTSKIQELFLDKESGDN